MDRGIHQAWGGNRFLGTGVLLLFTMAASLSAGAQSLEGITIIEFPKEAAPEESGPDTSFDFVVGSEPDFIAQGEFLVTFMEGDRGFATVTWRELANNYSGCTSTVAPGGNDASSMQFGMEAPMSARKIRLETYCPPFTVTRMSDTTVEIAVPSGERRTANIVVHVPRQEPDFDNELLGKMDIKGVSLGSVENPEDLKGLSAEGYGDRDRGFQHAVITEQGRSNILGNVAASEITGWPGHVLYYQQFLEQFPVVSSMNNFLAAVTDKYGAPSTSIPERGYMTWIFDLNGNQVDFAQTPMTNPCRKSIDYWMSLDAEGRPLTLDIERQGADIGPWGCGLIMEISANSSSTGVTGYSVRQAHGYVQAASHFHNGIQEAERLQDQVSELLDARPSF